VTPQTRPNPYVGPRAFQYGETLYGRDREVVELLDLLIAERIVLLYSPSGAGKTSLIQAGLIPELEKEGFRVLPVMRVSLEPAQALGSFSTANRYILSLLLSLEEALPDEQQLPLAELAGMELADYLDRRQVSSDGQEAEVLIFDQFEEILTVDPTDRAAKEAFFAQVGAALRHRQRWALFAMREEYPAGLDPYLRPIPTRLSTTYRLELLGEEAAHIAVQRPARQAGVDFTDAAATKLINDLRQVRVQRAEGTTEEQLGLYVEPVQLQVVCRRLWERLALDATQIGAENVEAVGDVDSALEGYYAEQVLAIAGATGVQERAIREWFDRQLITEQGIRGQVLQRPEESQGLANRAIMPLVDAHLVRAEKRRGATWFELAHDRLIEPVRKNNATWYQTNLSALQRQAALWEDQHRSPGLLLGGEALGEAEGWADTHEDELTSTEHDFLAACREARALAQRERRQARRIRWLAVGASIIGAIAFMAFLKARQAERDANDQAQEARLAKTQADMRRVEAERLLTVSIAQALAAQASRQHELAQDERGALLARQAYLFNQRSQGHALAQVDDALRTVLSTDNFSHILPGHQGWVWSVAFSPKGMRLASGGSDGTIRLWQLGTPEVAPAVLPGHQGRVWSVAFSPEGMRLASGGSDESIRIWATTETLPDRVCEKVWRNLTLDEWRRFVGTAVPYERTCSNLPVHSSFIEAGKNLARSGDVDGAIAIFQRALELDPSLTLNPKAEAHKLAARALVAKGQQLAQAGDLESAVETFQKAQALDSTLSLEPQAEAKKWVVQGLLAKGQELIRQGKVHEALEAYARAKTLDARQISAQKWNTVCWDGSLLGHAAEVKQACEQAVTLAPEDGGIRDSRGLARALTGEIDGAIADFQAFIAWTEDKERYVQQRAQRQRWIEDLRAGKNPFAPEELEKLREQ
jgi:tetratricopeptide (TPR) repeat protein